MTVIVEGVVVDETGAPDLWHWGFASVIRESDGRIVSSAARNVAPDKDGHLTVDLVPGYCQITYRDQAWLVTVPDHAIGLWELIETAVAVPPGTPADALAAAVESYMAAHPVGLPDHVGHVGEYLRADDTGPSWDTVDVTLDAAQLDGITSQVEAGLEPPVSFVVLIQNALT